MIGVPQWRYGGQWAASGWRTEEDGIIDFRDAARLEHPRDYGMTSYILPKVRVNRGFVQGDWWCNQCDSHVHHESKV